MHPRELITFLFSVFPPDNTTESRNTTEEDEGESN
jgi:hypothetical protein